MTRIVLTPDLRPLLNDLKEPLELCDPQGMVVARVFPQMSDTHPRRIPSFTDKQLQVQTNMVAQMSVWCDVLHPSEDSFAEWVFVT